MFTAVFSIVIVYQTNLKLPKSTKAFSINNMEEQKEEKGLLLGVGVLNRLHLKGRRDIIRMTWFQVCKQNPMLVRCNFFTDSYDGLKKPDVDKLLEEKRTHNDMLFMPITGGHKFTERLLWMMQWYIENYSSFQYFLRVDDDYFICMDRLLYELPFRPDNGLYWGWTHCYNRIVRVDEGWMMLSRDIIDEVLSKLNSTLPCHPFGDQSVALWIQDSKLDIKWFPDNNRIVHEATAYKGDQYMFPELCNRHLALHGSYDLQMLKYWILTEKNNNIRYSVPPIPPFTSFYNKDKKFDVNAFHPPYRYPAKLCKISLNGTIQINHMLVVRCIEEIQFNSL